MVVSANRLELLQIADAVAREKSIDRQIVVDAMQDAIAKAARSRYGAETDVHAEINTKTGELRLARHLQVVDLVENGATEITVAEAKRHNPAAQVGDGQGLHRSVPRALQLAILRVATDGDDDARAVAAREHCNDGVAPPISQARRRLGRRPALAKELRRP